MINRRLLRIKVLQTYYAYIKRGRESLPLAEKELKHSVEKAYDLYFFLLLLVVDIVDYAQLRIELARQKKMPTQADLHPNTIFIDNLFIAELRKHPAFIKQIRERKISWSKYPELIKKLYHVIYQSESYTDYMDQADSGWEEDKKFISNIYTTVIALSEDLENSLEEQSIYWNDDLEFILGMIIKSIKKTKPGKLFIFAGDQIYKSPEDKKFTFELFRQVVIKGNDYKALIEKYLENWDIERVALMDILIMELAITEMVAFPEIPVKVSLNEYIEIAKDYSSKKSGTFINGILDRITGHLKEQKLIKKKGKGLIGEMAI